MFLITVNTPLIKVIQMNNVDHASSLKNSVNWIILFIVIFFSVVFCMNYTSDDSDAAVGTEFTVDGNNYSIISESAKTVELKSPVSKSITAISIPETVEYLDTTYTVTSIASYAFYGCSSALSINIPHTVKSIGSYAFASCWYVTSLSYDVAENHFSKPEFIFGEIGAKGTGVSVVFGEHVRKIPSNIFAHRNIIGAKPNYVKTIMIEEGTTHIASHAFSNCSSLNTITIPSTVVELGENALYETSSLTTVYFNAKSLPDYSGAPSIFGYSGIGSSKAIKLIFGNSVERIPAYFAYGTYSRVGEVVIPASVKSIGVGAFDNNQRLSTVTFYGVPELEGVCFSCGTSFGLVKVTVNSICSDRFLSPHVNAYTKITYNQLPHVALNMSGLTPTSIPDTWALLNGALHKYYEKGESISIPEIHVKGYTFKGWDVTPATTMGTVNLTYNSIWEINHVTLTFDSAGGTSVPTFSGDYGDPITITPPKRTGYDFLGWTPTLPQTVPEYNQSFTAKWRIQTHTVSYYNTGDTTVNPVSITYGTTIPLPNVSKIGHTFQGWSLSPAGNTMGEKDVVATAQWSVNSYTLTFDSNGGSAVSPITQYYGSSIYVADPVWTGHIFQGWSPSLPSTIPAVNQKYTAQWSLESHKVTYYNTGDSTIPQAIVFYGDNIPLPTVTMVGYTFDEWVLQPAGNKMGTSDVKVIGTWTVNSYTLKFDTKGGTSISDITASYGSPLNVADPEKENYLFDGWSPQLPATVPASNQTFTAKWVKESHTVSYNTAGGNSIPSCKVDCGDIIPLPTPTRAGYDFTGWTLNPSETVMSHSDVTATAGWKLATIILTFNTNGGSSIAQVKGHAGETFSVQNPTKTGYTFANWSPALPSVIPQKNTTYTAQWKVTVSFDPNGGSGNQTPLVVSSDVRCPLPQFTTFHAPSGKSFDGWSLSPTGSKVYSIYPTENITVYALWKTTAPAPKPVSNTVTLTLKEKTTYAGIYNSYAPYHGGTVEGAGTYNKGQTVEIKAIATDEYRFVKWEEDGNTSPTRTITLDESVTYTAVFESYSEEVEQFEKAAKLTGWTMILGGIGVVVFGILVLVALFRRH